jgi:V8-like Glu-specific endopeptidase
MGSATEDQAKGSDGKVGVPLPGDNRTRVPNTTVVPSKWVGQLETHWANGDTGVGTATLIGGRHLVTCGHNFYNTDNNTQPTRARWRPGLNRSAGGVLQEPFGSYDVEWWDVPEDYRNNGGPPPPAWGIAADDITLYLHDYAVARLDRFVHDNLGESLFQVSWPGDATVNGLGCRINGYSGDLDATGSTQYTRHGNVRLSDTTEYVSYQMSTYNGDSGAGVYYQPPARPFYTIVAIHVTGVPDTGHNDGLNFGPSMKGAALDWVQARLG